jgi:lycopene cyclase domain-containing protein
LFLELSIVVFFLGFGWEHWSLRELGARLLWVPAISLACFWFLIDQVAIALGLWTFPGSGTVPIRLFSLPIEEYLLFFLHTLLCFILLKCCSGTAE